MRWLLQLGGRWLVSQVWRGAREGVQRAATGAPNQEHQGQSNKAEGVPAAHASARQNCALGVLCETRRLFDTFAEQLKGKRTIEASRFRLLSGLLGGEPVVVALPRDATRGLTPAVAALCDGHHPPFVVAVGEGMGGDVAVPPGDLVVANLVVGPGNQRLELDGASPEAAWVHRGRVDAASGSVHNSLAIDSWSWESAVACRSVGVPLVAMSAITKPGPGQESPGADLLQPSATLARRTGTFAGLLWRQPKELKRAWELQTAAWQACDRAVKLVSYMAKASATK